MVSAIVSNSFAYRMKQRIDFAAWNVNHDIRINWYTYDHMSDSELRDFVAQFDHIILENRYDDKLFRYVSNCNCLYVDNSPLRDLGFILDRGGWDFRSNIRRNTFWRHPLTKMGKREIIKFTEQYGIPYEKGPNENGPVYYVPSKYSNRTQTSMDLIRESGNIGIEKVVTDVSYPKSAIETAESFASEIGAEFSYYKKNGLRLDKASKIISDDVESTIWGLLSRIPVYTIAPSIFSSIHVAREYLGSMSFLQNTYEEADWSYADSVIYRLMAEVVPVMIDPEELAVQSEFSGFLLQFLLER